MHACVYKCAHLPLDYAKHYVDEGKVEIIDPLYKNKELYQDIIDLLQR